MINLIDEQIYDITYIGIGSAVIRDTEPQNRQQLPPFLESIYYNTNYNIHIINIDPKFEKPYFLTTYLDDSFSKERFKITYINEEIDILTCDFNKFDTLNKIIMDNNKLLICGNFTGLSNSEIENKFINHYENTKYKDKYYKYITYNFFIYDDIGCTINLLNNFPIIDYNNSTLIKIYNIIPENFMEIYEKLISIDEFYKEIIKKKIILKFIEFIDLNHYVYRNIKNNNINNNIISSIQFSIFKDDQSLEYITELFKFKILEYYNIIKFLYFDHYSELEYYINNIEQYNDYEWINKFKKILNNN